MNAEDKAEVSKMITDAIQELKNSLGVGSTPKLKADEKFKPKYRPDAKVTVEYCEGANHHKSGTRGIHIGHQATNLVRKGYCKFISAETEEETVERIKEKNTKKS